jgi:hypothetical protein
MFLIFTLRHTALCAVVKAIEISNSHYETNFGFKERAGKNVPVTAD